MVSILVSTLWVIFISCNWQNCHEKELETSVGGEPDQDEQLKVNDREEARNALRYAQISWRPRRVVGPLQSG